MKHRVFLGIVLTLLGYSLIPLANQYLEGVSEYTFLLDSMIINPLVALIGSGFLCYVGGYQRLTALTVGFLFVPIAFVFYNDSALIYTVLYIIIAFLSANLMKRFSVVQPMKGLERNR